MNDNNNEGTKEV